MGVIIDFLLRPRIDRRQYWISLPPLGLACVGGWLLVQWSYAVGDVVPLRLSGIGIALTAFSLGLWVVGRRMKDTGGEWILWLVGISVGGRLAQAGVRLVGGSHDQGEAALGLVIGLVLVGLAFVPSARETSSDERGEEDDEGEAEASL